MNDLIPTLDEDIDIAIDNAYGTAESWVERRLVDMRDSIRDEPVKSVLIAGAIGAVIGRFFLR